MIWWAILLLIVGFAFVFLELLVPSFGIITMLAAVSIIGGAVLAFYQGTYFGIGYVAAAIMGVPMMLKLGLKILPKTPVGKNLFVQPDQETTKPLELEDSELLNCTGKTVTDLKPVGKAVINGKKVEVQSKGEYIVINTEIKVIEINNNRLFVKEVKTVMDSDNRV